jgi:predicted small lipoprotein YifL
LAAGFISVTSGSKRATGWRWWAIMSHLRLTESRHSSPEGRKITRRAFGLTLMLASLAACGRKGPLELPPEDDEDDDDEDAPGAIENPDTYGDPMTFPEPDEDEESVE